MDGTESYSENPTNKILKPFLGEAIRLFREVIKLRTIQNLGLGRKSKVDSTFSLNADCASYSTS